MCGREVIVPKSADPGPGTAAGRENQQPKSADPGPGTAAGRENQQTKSASVVVVVVAVVVVATRESQLCRQSHPNFEGLVLGCMGSYDSEQSHILQHFSSSTR